MNAVIRYGRPSAAVRRTAWAAWVAFLLGWMLHIAVDRVAGYNLRGKDGFIRA
jgi:hypothetical protein